MAALPCVPQSLDEHEGSLKHAMQYGLCGMEHSLRNTKRQLRGHPAACFAAYRCPRIVPESKSRTSSNHKTVCVVGAGCAGLSACNALRERGIPYVCYEKGSKIGGLWRIENDNGLSGAYESLSINTSKSTMEFAGFPFPEEWTPFLSHKQVLEYIEQYAAHFDLKKNIQFETTVTEVAPHNNGGYTVSIQRKIESKPKSKHFATVIVANGHHWDPLFPTLPGKFAGQLLHAHQYRNHSILDDKRVVVLGMGNSGVDIASEASKYARSVIISSRESAYVVPRWIKGKPMDTINTSAIALLPWRWRQWLFSQQLKPFIQEQIAAGWGVPKHGLMQAHFTIHKDIVEQCKAKKVTPKSGIKQISGNLITFMDGTSVEVDVIVCATGYNVTFPFFKGNRIRVVDEDGPRLYKNMIHPEHPNLFFVGLLQPTGPMIPLCEQQTALIGDILQGKVVPPCPEKQLRAIQLQKQRVKDRWISAQRHLLEVDFHEYLMELKCERCPSKISFWERILYTIKVYLEALFPRTGCLGATRYEKSPEHHQSIEK
eukprot:jgi/Botrbrau1/20181/Bobra.0173s0079.1